MKTYCKPLKLLSLVLLFSPLVLARGRVQGYCTQGNQAVVTPGSQNSTTRVQRSYPACTVNVYAIGTTTHVTLFSDVTGTALANPFTATTSTGSWFFYTDSQLVDVNLSGSGISTPFTLGSLPVSDPLRILADTAFSTLAAACTLAAAQNYQLAIGRVWTAQPNLTCTPSVMFLPGGSVQPANGAALSFTGNISAPSNTRIFDTTLSGAGGVLLPLPAEDVWVNWFGADTTGAANSQPAFTSAIAAIANAAAQPNGATLRLTCGTYLLNSTVTFTSSFMLGFHGSGACTQLTWGGNNSTPMLMVQDNLQSEFGNFQIVGSAAHQLLYGIQEQNSGSGTRWTSTLARFIDITIEGVAQYITTGVFLGGGTDGNNDQQYFESVAVKNYLHSGFTINHSQIYDATFKKCQFSGNGLGAIGLENIVGNFHWEGGTSGGNTAEDFLISGINGGTYLIADARFEGSATFLVTGGPAGNPLALTLRGVNFAGDKLGCTAMQISGGTCPSPPPGGNVVNYKFRGPLVIDNSSFGGSQLTPVTFALQGFGALFNFASMRDTIVSGSLTTVATIFPSGKPNSIVDSFAYNQNTDDAFPLALSASQPVVTFANSTTPTLQPGVTRYFTSNTVPTVITNFLGCTAGQTFNVIVNDANTSFTTAGTPPTNLVWLGANPIVALSGDNLQFTCTFDNGASWLTVSKGH